MPPQENKSVIPAAGSLYAATGALFGILLASQSNWIWASLYFQLQTATEIGLAFACAGFIAVAGICVLNRVLGCAKTLKAINFAMVVLLFFIVLFIGMKELGGIPHAMTAMQKALAVAIACAIAFVSAFKITPSGWARIYPASMVAALMFTFFPWLFAVGSAPTVYWPSPSRQAATVIAPTAPAQNTIVLLLDEFSASAAAPVVDSLKETGLNVIATSIRADGKDTINVVPAIWLRKNFDRSAACGPTQLCSGANVLDFAKTKASASNIDVVAFYHRYCAIQGLRSCRFYPFRKKWAVTELACRLLMMPSYGPLDCNASVADRRYFLALRDNMQQAVMDAPFWQQGGLLYAHLLEPHPLMGVAERPLSEEYAANIRNGAAFVKRIAEKAQSTFGSNFSIIIFSDHPLRPEVWCGEAFYAADKCAPTPGQISNRVPLIIATSKADQPAPPHIDNNRAVFDLVFK